jgi:uncharacterized protein (DUF2345 family)
MYKPVFPYKGNQLILTSDRVTLHAKNDAIFLFGKQAVGLSSTNTINLDAVNKVIVAAPVIELGNKAQDLGEPVVLGNTLNQKLIALLEALDAVAIQLAQASTSKPGQTAQYISQAGTYLSSQVNSIKGQLQPGTSEILSKNTFTR